MFFLLFFIHYISYVISVRFISFFVTFQCCFAPLFLPFFLGTMGIMRCETIEAFCHQIKKDFVPARKWLKSYLNLYLMILNNYTKFKKDPLKPSQVLFWKPLGADRWMVGRIHSFSEGITINPHHLVLQCNKKKYIFY